MTANLDTAKVEAHVAGRKEANVAAELVITAAKELFEASGKEACDAFWLTIRETLWPDRAAKLAKPATHAPADAMTDEEARLFGNDIMNFGKYKGARVDDVPLDYLEYIDGDDWRGKLRRYLRSRRIRVEQDQMSLPFEET